MMEYQPWLWRTLVSVVTIVALLASSCGGGEDSGTGQASATPTSEPSATAVETAATPSPANIAAPEVVPSQCPSDVLASADSPVEVTFWHSMTATNGQVIERFVADYNASQNLVVVTAAFQGVYRESFEKYINTLRSGGNRPDVIQANETVLQQMVDSESIVPVQACIDADGYDTADFVGRLLDQYRVGGVIVTMPFQLSNPVLYYDGADLVEAGLDPDEPPETFDEVLEMSRLLVEAGVVDTPIASDIDAWFIEQWISMAGTALVDNDNGRSARATATLLDSDAALAAYEFLATLRDEGLIQNTGRGTDQSEIGKYLAVAFGDATMTIGSSSTLGEIYTQIGQFPDVDLRVARLPGPASGGTAVGGGSLYLSNTTSDEVRAGVWDFMKWVNEPAQQIAWSAATGYIPTRQSAIGDAELDALWAERPGFRVAFDQLAAAAPIPGGGGPVIGDHSGVRDAIEESLEALFQGDTAVQALAQAKEEADKAIEDYNRRIGE